MVSTRRQAAAASASEDASDARQADDTSAAVSSKRSTAATTQRRAAKRTLDPVVEAPTPRRSRRRPEPPTAEPPTAELPTATADAAAPAPTLETAESPRVSSGDGSDGEAYSALLASIFAGLEGGDADAAGDDDSDGGDADGDDEDGVVVETQQAGGAAGAEAGEEGEGGEHDAVGVLAWKPDIGMPSALTADASGAAAAVGLRKEVGLAKQVVAPPRGPRKEARQAAKKRQDSTGPGWFDMSAQPITDQVKQDWRLLRLRAAYNPRHFYKSFDSTKIPKYFQMGELVEGTGEFYSGRLTKRERKQTFAEELLADISLKRERQKRYSKMQEEATKWSKHRKKNHPKIKRSAHRPKH